MIMSKQSGVSNIIYGLLVIAILSSAIFGLTRLESTFDNELYDTKSEIASVSSSISDGITLINDCQLVITHDSGSTFLIDDTLCPIPKTAFEELATEISAAYPAPRFSKIDVNSGSCDSVSGGYHSLQIDGITTEISDYNEISPGEYVTSGAQLNGYVNLILQTLPDPAFTINFGSDAFATLYDTIEIEGAFTINSNIEGLEGAVFIPDSNYFQIDLSSENFDSLDGSICISWPNSNTSASIVNYHHYTINYGLDQEFYDSVLEPTSDLLLSVYLTNTTSISDYFDTDEYMGYFSSNSLKSYPTFIRTNDENYSCETLFPDVHTHSFSISEEFIGALTSTSDTVNVQEEIPFVVDREKRSLLELNADTDGNTSLRFKYDTNGTSVTDIPIYLDSIVCTLSGDTSEANLSSFHSTNKVYAEALNDDAAAASELLVGDVNLLLLEDTSLYTLDNNETEIKLITVGSVGATHSDDIETLKVIHEELMVHFINNNGWLIKTDLVHALLESYDKAGINMSSVLPAAMINYNLFLVHRDNLEANGSEIDTAINEAEDAECEIEFAPNANNANYMYSTNYNDINEDPDSPVCQYPNDAFAEGQDENGYIQLSSSVGTCDFLEDNSHRIQIVEFSNITSESTTSFSGENITVTAEKLNADTLQITITGAAVTYGSDQYASGSTIDFTMSADPADDDLCIYWSNEEWQQ